MANTRRYWDGERWTEHRQEKASQVPQPDLGQAALTKVATRVVIGIGVLIAIWLVVGGGWEKVTNSGTTVDPDDIELSIQGRYSEEDQPLASIECDDPGEVHDNDVTYCRGKSATGIPVNLRVTFKSDGSFRWETM